MEDPAIRFEGVTKSFDRLTVLDNVSFEVPRGTSLCVLGRSGTGKSVLIKQLIGLLKPDSGRIYVETEEISGLAAGELARVRRRMGFLFQYSALFDSISVGENVAFPLRRHTRLSDAEIRGRVGEKLKRVGLEGIEDRMPSEISGGMRKRVGLARALALEPPILLADEPSSGLDPVTSQEIDELLLDLKHKEGTTMVVPSFCFKPRSSSSISREVMGSRPLEGSSASRMGGSRASARASPTRLRMPPEISEGIRSSIPSRPTRFNFSPTRPRISASESLVWRRSGKATFSPTEMESNSAEY